MATRQDGNRTFSGRDARQGEIILKTPLSRAIFVAGIVGAVVAAMILAACIPVPPS